MGQKQPKHPSPSKAQQPRTPTSDDRKDANDMDSNRKDPTQRSGAHQQQGGHQGQHGSGEANAQHRQQR